MRVGVLGGTFDPIHLGHLIIAEEARVRLGMDSVVFMPAGRPWLKEHEPGAEVGHRLEMVRMAVEGNPYFSYSRLEVERQENSYTADTLERMRRTLPEGAELLFILGLDSLREFAGWHRPERVLELATLVALVRPGYEDVQVRALDDILPEASQRVVLLEGPLLEISSTDIRRRVAKGHSIRYLVPQEVEEYIQRTGLYLTKEAAK